jgi:hypothetical protein
MASSFSQLAETNIPLMRRPDQVLEGSELEFMLKECLTSTRLVSLETATTSVVDFIHMVAKPSLLNKIETEIHRISPYPFRKEVKKTILDYFNGRIGISVVSKLLRKSLKLDALHGFMWSNDAMLLKQGVEAVAQGQDPEAVGLRLNVPTFDILYLRNAGNPKPKKEKKPKDKPKP